MTFGCDLLTRAKVTENNSGIRFDPHGRNEVVTTSKDVVNICLNCPYDECLVVQRAKVRVNKGMVVR